jgi:hypothetical protein
MRPDSPRATVAQSVGRAWRHLRALRPDRLAPAERVAEWAQSFRQWLGVRAGQKPQVNARQQVTPTLGQRIDPPRQSRGIRL